MTENVAHTVSQLTKNASFRQRHVKPVAVFDLPVVAASRGSTANFGKPNCPICHGVGYLAADVPPGHPRFGRIESCACRNDEVVRIQAEKLGALTNLLPHELDIRLDQLHERGHGTRAMLQAARHFLEKPHGMLTLWGEAGNGKTAVLMALVNHFNEQRFGQAAYYRFVDLLNVIREGYHPEAEVSAAERYRRLKEIWFLAIDEVDKVALTEWAQEFRARFFDDRYRLAREGLCHTALALNENPEALPEPIVDRLRWASNQPGGFRVIYNGDSSARPAGL
jgi:DNA replication protein DnaC